MSRKFIRRELLSLDHKVPLWYELHVHVDDVVLDMIEKIQDKTGAHVEDIVSNSVCLYYEWLFDNRESRDVR